MSLELSNAPLPDAESRRRVSPTISTGTTAGSTAQDDKEHLSSRSQTSSPRLTSILLPPLESGGARPRSSEGRVASLNLPKHPPRQGSSQPSTLGPSRRRSVTHKNVNKTDRQGNGNGSGLADDGLFNFGMGDDYTMEPEDPQVLEDVQRALKIRALREAHSKSGVSTPTPESSPLKVGPTSSRSSGEVASHPSALAPTLPVTPPKRVTPAISNRTSIPSSAATPKVVFPLYTHSPSRSLESISSDDQSGRFPVPVLMSSRDGLTHLDWSGAPLSSGTPEKDRSFLGRTFSITRRKNKEKARLRGLASRNSLDFGASQGDLHAATLDSIRRTSKRETLSRAEIAKEELGRRYAALVRHKPTGEPSLTILDVVKWRSDDAKVSTPWLAWCHQGGQEGNVWTVTADLVDEYLQASGRSPTHSSFSSPSVTTNVRSHSPSYGLVSPFSSPRPSLSISPNNNAVLRKGQRRMELGRSLSANPVIEGVATTSLSPTLSRSLSLTQAPTFGTQAAPSPSQRRSIDAVMGPIRVSLNDSPRTSLDPGSGSQGLSSPSKTEKESIRKKVRVSLSGDKVIPTLDSRTSTMSSLTNLFGTAHGHSGVPSTSTSGRLQLGVGNMFGRMRRSGDESGEAQIERSRSSVSDERDSAQDGEGTKSDEPAGLRRSERARMSSRLEVLGMRPRGKYASNTSDSETGGGPFSARFGKRFRGVDKDSGGVLSAEETTGEVAREFIFGGEQRQVDVLASPGWTSRRGVRRTRVPPPKEIGREKLQEILRKQEEEEEREKEVYKARERMLVETNDHNRRMARLLKAVGALIRENEEVQVQLAEAVGCPHEPMPLEVLDAVSADPATTLRHGKGWRAVEDSHRRFTNQQASLASYLSILAATPEQEDWSDLGDAIQESDELWSDLRIKSQQIDKQGATVKPALKKVVEHMNSVQREYNNTLILVETDYPEQTRIADLEMIITESRAPRGWLEFAAFWIPEHVLEFIGGFIRFFGVPISEKFIRPFLWYFFRNRYYWKIYSTEPPPSERAWYTRLGYWIVILSILAWYTTA